MRKILFITPHDAEYGFSLSGIGQMIADRAATEETLNKAMANAENGLIVIDERLVANGHDQAGIAEEQLREMENRWQGIMLVLPSPEKPPAETEDYAARLIRRAIGYHVRLKL